MDDKRKVRYCIHEKTSKGNWVRIKNGEGIFHQFGVAYEEYEAGAGNYSTAIIESPDGTVLNIPVEDIEFIK